MQKNAKKCKKMQKNAKNAKKCNLQGKKGVRDKKRPFKKVQYFSPAPSAPVKAFLSKGENARIFTRKMQKNAKNATYKAKKPLQKKMQKNATTQQKMQNGPKCKKMQKNAFAYLALPCNRDPHF